MTGRERPLISAVITSHNRRTYVLEAIESALRQTYEPMEVIVVDDGSTDGSPELIRQRFGTRVHLVEQPNAGVGATRNRGVQEARGVFVGFLDDDDIWLPEKTERQWAVFEREDNDVVVVGGATRYIDHEGNPILRPTFAPTEISHDEICVWTALPGSCSNELVRRDAFERVGGFDPTLVRCQDRELYMRLAAVGRILVAPEITLLKRVHDGVRPGVDFQRVFEERSRVNERIADPRVRRKADAMLYFHLVRLARRERRSGDALRYLLRSALAWPGRIAPRVVRWRYVAEWLVPGPLRALARGILGRRASRGGAHASD